MQSVITFKQILTSTRSIDVLQSHKIILASTIKKGVRNFEYFLLINFHRKNLTTIQGVIRLGSRGNIDVFLTLPKPK